MTEALPRAETTRQAQSDEEAAAAIGAAVASGATVAVVAPAVLAVLPRPVLVLEGGQVAALIASSVATFAVEEPPELETTADADSVAEFYEELVFRGLYALSAARRLIAAIGEGTTLSERRALIRDALTVERRFFEQHLEAQRRRSRARQSGRDAVARWGQEVSWVHGHPKEPRPTHLAADGRNFRPALGPPVLTGVLPGVLPGCTCTYGPPKADAAVMASARAGASDSPTLSEDDRTDLGISLPEWTDIGEVLEFAFDAAKHPKWPKGTPGGRGGKFMPKGLPEFAGGLIPSGKLKYALEGTKGRVLRSVGFSQSRLGELESAIREGIPNGELRGRGHNGFGYEFQLDFDLRAPNGKIPPVRSGWIILDDEKDPRMTTLFVRTTEWRRRERDEV